MYFKIFILLGFTNLAFAQQYWIQKPSPTAFDLKRIQFVDTLYGWAAGDSGTVINTTNGGASWQFQNTGIPNLLINDIFFLNRNLGWGAANNYIYSSSHIMKTTNGGLSWQVNTFPDSSVVISYITFVNASTGFISGFSGRIFKSTNGGINWYETRVDSNYCPLLYLLPKLNFNFFNAQTGFVCGGHFDLQGIIWRTTDGGENWLTFCCSPEPVKRIKALSPERIFSVGGDPEFGASTVQSYDSGKSWNYDTTGFFGIGSAIAFRTAAEVWVPLSIDTFWAVNTDSGGFHSAWRKVPTPNRSYIFDAMFVTPTFGWASGLNGVLAKYNSDIIGISEISNTVPISGSLSQNYPNPFNPSTSFKFQVTGSSDVKIIIYDLLGREAAVLVNEHLKSGTYEVKWDGTGYPSGVYLYKMISDGYTQTKKMVLLK